MKNFIKEILFEYEQFKTKRLRLKVWKTTIKLINSFCEPSNDYENLIMKNSIMIADKFVDELRKHIDFYRNLIE